MYPPGQRAWQRPFFCLPEHTLDASRIAAEERTVFRQLHWDMAAKVCRVSFTDADGVVRVAQVQAHSLYEAAVLGLRALNRPDWIEVIGPYTRITVRVHEPPVEHFVMFAQLAQWLDRPARDAVEQMKKARLKAFLAPSATS